MILTILDRDVRNKLQTPLRSHEPCPGARARGGRRCAHCHWQDAQAVCHALTVLVGPPRATADCSCDVLQMVTRSPSCSCRWGGFAGQRRGAGRRGKRQKVAEPACEAVAPANASKSSRIKWLSVQAAVSAVHRAVDDACHVKPGEKGLAESTLRSVIAVAAPESQRVCLRCVRCFAKRCVARFAEEQRSAEFSVGRIEARKAATASVTEAIVEQVAGASSWVRFCTKNMISERTSRVSLPYSVAHTS